MLLGLSAPLVLDALGKELDISREIHPVDVIEQVAHSNDWAFERCGDDEADEAVAFAPQALHHSLSVHAPAVFVHLDPEDAEAHAGLAAVSSALFYADLAWPQNYFTPLPWHAAWDTARILLNRALGADSPGTLGVRRSFFTGMGGYSDAVMYENLELIRTVTAHGGRIAERPDIYVRRVPGSVRRFWEQRPRQAYDDFAQPGALVREVFNDAERDGLVETVAGALLGGVRSPVLERAFEYWKSVDPDVGRRIEGKVRSGSAPEPAAGMSES